jgi:hypothetical protein
VVAEVETGGDHKGAEGLEKCSEPVEIGGRTLMPGIEGTVDVVARSHVEFRGRDGSEWVDPLTKIDVVIRQPHPGS